MADRLGNPVGAHQDMLRPMDSDYVAIRREQLDYEILKAGLKPIVPITEEGNGSD